MNPVIVIPACTFLLVFAVFSWRGRTLIRKLFEPLDRNPWW